MFPLPKGGRTLHERRIPPDLFDLLQVKAKIADTINKSSGAVQPSWVGHIKSTRGRRDRLPIPGKIALGKPSVPIPLLQPAGSYNSKLLRPHGYKQLSQANPPITSLDRYQLVGYDPAA